MKDIKRVHGPDKWIVASCKAKGAVAKRKARQAGLTSPWVMRSWERKIHAVKP